MSALRYRTRSVRTDMLLCISAMTFLTRTASGGTSAPCRGLDCGITRIAAIILISVRSLRPPFHRISYVF